MAKWCPKIDDYVVYLDCLDCDNKICMQMPQRNEEQDEKHIDKKE